MLPLPLQQQHALQRLQLLQLVPRERKQAEVEGGERQRLLQRLCHLLLPLLQPIKLGRVAGTQRFLHRCNPYPSAVKLQVSAHSSGASQPLLLLMRQLLMRLRLRRH